MTVRPFYEPRVLMMPLEKYAEIAIDGGIWLVGEVLARAPSMSNVFVPDRRYIYLPRNQKAAITELGLIQEELRHRSFIAGFLKLPDNGARATFQRLPVTHAEMLKEAFRKEWRRRRSIDFRKPRGRVSTVANELLHKLATPR